MQKIIKILKEEKKIPKGRIHATNIYVAFVCSKRKKNKRKNNLKTVAIFCLRVVYYNDKVHTTCNTRQFGIRI